VFSHSIRSEKSQIFRACSIRKYRFSGGAVSQLAAYCGDLNFNTKLVKATLAPVAMVGACRKTVDVRKTGGAARDRFCCAEIVVQCRGIAPQQRAG
jgi:hypothetical protein